VFEISADVYFVLQAYVSLTEFMRVAGLPLGETFCTV
jgi:hypothetical protein